MHACTLHKNTPEHSTAQHIDINISNEITSLGVIMDSKLTLDSHISAICKSCYYHLRSLRHIRRSLTQNMAISVAVAIVQSRLDYCNSLLYDISTFNINKLQRVQNLAARLALNDWHSPSHVLVSKLHWLPVLSRIKFKISSLTYKLLNDHQPGYLSSLISPYTPVRSLRSSDMSLLTQPLARLSIGRRAFSVCVCPTALECLALVNSKCDFSFIIQTVPQNSLLSNTDSILIPCDCPGLRFGYR